MMAGIEKVHWSGEGGKTAGRKDLRPVALAPPHPQFLTYLLILEGNRT